MNELPKTMKGVWLTGHGELDKLDVRSDIPVPKPTANDVLIRVGAAAVNNTDINTRTAWYSKGDVTSKMQVGLAKPLNFPVFRELMYADILWWLAKMSVKIELVRESWLSLA